MRINTDNYEQYFLDHAEGRLSPEMERELAEFLLAHPDLKSQLENYDPTPLEPSPLSNAVLKNLLKKNIKKTIHIHEDNIDEWLIRELEDDLNEDEKTELEEFLTYNPAYHYDRKLFALSRLKADPSTRFTRKELLKKEVPILSLKGFAWALSSAAAAIILMFIGFRFFQQPESRQIASFTMPAISWAGALPEALSPLKWNPKSNARNSKSDFLIRNPKPETRNPKPGTLNPEPGTRNPQPSAPERRSVGQGTRRARTTFSRAGNPDGTIPYRNR